MILQKLRLKNIKSYGEGSDKNGVTISFEPGVNRVAGKNGAGKTTLIEAIGYVLFGAQPFHEEHFAIDTYFLQTGKKLGEIELTFEVEGEVYRVHRGIGSANKIRQKLIRVADDSCDAEGDNEVSDALCKLFKVSDSIRLSELFTKLIGIKQGHLPIPFDSKKRDALDHFETLMDVAIFRECHEKLKPVVDNIRSMQSDLNVKLAAATQQIKDRADSPQKKIEAEESVKTVSGDLEVAMKERAAAEGVKNGLESKASILATAEKVKVAKASDVDRATDRRRIAEAQLNEAATAVKTVAETAAASAAYVQADQLLTKLQEKHAERLALQRNRGEMDSQCSSLEQQAKLLLERTESDTMEASEKKNNLLTVQVDVQTTRVAFDAGQSDFDLRSKNLKIAETHQKAVEEWIGKVNQAAARISSQTALLLDNWRQISDWDRAQLKSAVAELEAASDAKQSAGEDLAAAVQYKKTLEGQLIQISGGTCPFLQTKCKQFEPDQVQGDVASHELKIASLRKLASETATHHASISLKVKNLTEAEARINALVTEVTKSVASLIKESEPCLDVKIEDHLSALKTQFVVIRDSLVLPSLSRRVAPDLFAVEVQQLNPAAVTDFRDAIQSYSLKVKSFSGLVGIEIASARAGLERLSNERAAVQQRLISNEETINRLQRDILSLTERATSNREKVALAAATAEKLRSKITEVDRALQAFADLDRHVEEASARKAANASAHEKYLGAKPTADMHDTREATLVEANQVLQEMEKTLILANEAVLKAQEGFDEGALAVAKIQFQESADRTSRLTERKKFLDAELKNQQKRFEELTQVHAEVLEFQQEMGRLEAAEELTEQARSLLQKAAPAVAQSICNRITARAQQTFNSLNHDPAELSWNSDNYSLRINTPTMNDGRFSMLSGGEQTKLALSMVLSMIHEFISCGFCIFDEPTYGIDVDSKQKLADSIIRVQEACKLQQLLLVSHDNAFDGKVEHILTVSKSGIEGSLLVPV